MTILRKIDVIHPEFNTKRNSIDALLKYLYDERRTD
jgi:hypothetical protein